MGGKLIRKGLVIGIIVLFIAFDLPVTGTINSVNTKPEKEKQHSVIENPSITNTNCDDVDWWPMHHHDLNNSGYSLSHSAPETNNILWIYQTGFWVVGSPAVVNGKVYIGSDDEYFYCLNADTGALIWRNEIPGGTSTSSPCVVDGRVYVGTTYDYIFCWDADTGEEIWKFYKGYGVSRSPAVSDGKVYMPLIMDNIKPKICCLDADTGNEIWNRTFLDGEINNVAVYDEKVFVPHDYGMLFCLDSETGEIIWEKATNGKQGSPAIGYSKVYATGDGIYCLDVDTGEEIWHFQGSWTYCTPAVAYYKIYYVSSDGKIICLDADNGDEVWTYIIGSYYEHAFSSPAVADGKVYFGICSNGNLLCLNASDGEFIWDYPVSPGDPGSLFSSPSIADGRVYIGSSYTYNIYCFEDEFYNFPPKAPDINGQTNGTVGTSYTYTFNSFDPNGDEIYYYILWGDGHVEVWDGPHASGIDFDIIHTYKYKGSYTIKAKAKDCYGAESDWNQFTVTMPRNKAFNFNFNLLEWLFERFPNAFRIL